MGRKIMVVTTLIVFTFFTFACMIHRIEKRSVPNFEPAESYGYEIVGALLTDGEKIEFSKKFPAKIHKGVLLGEPKGSKKSIFIDKHMVIPKSKVKKARWIGWKENYEISTIDGEIFIPIRGSVSKYPDRFEFNIKRIAEDTTISIPVSEVDLVWIREVDLLSTFFTTMAFVSGILYLGYNVLAYLAFSGI